MASVTRALTHTDAAIIERSWHEPEWFAEAFDQFTAILRNGGIVPPKLEAAIFRAMKRLPGVELIRNGVPAGGHETLALGRVNGFLYDQVLLDRKTFTYRGERSEIVKENESWERAKGIEPVGHAKGTVILFERLTTAIVDKPGQLP